MFAYIFEVKKEFLVFVSLSVLYLTYYLVEVVKKPILICRKGDFRQLLEENVPILNEYYWPTPWCVESRLQTFLGSMLRSLLLPPLQFRREVLQLSDGGQVALDWLVGDGEVGCGGGEPRAVLLVLPGISGDARADYVRCLAASARCLRAQLVVFNNRGLGGLPLTTPRLYSAVSYEDVAEAVGAVSQRAGRGVPVLAAGVSLGGLLLGRYLAESGERAQLLAALTVSTPLDVVRGSQSIERWGLNAALSWYMARQLRGTVRARLPGSAARVRGCRSLRAFDAAFTAPHFGFASPDEYYRAASLRPRLARVARPLLCLCAADDPIQPADVLPLQEAAGSEHVALCVTARGGHIGFLEGWWPARSAHHQYVARLAAQYFGALLQDTKLPSFSCGLENSSETLTSLQIATSTTDSKVPSDKTQLHVPTPSVSKRSSSPERT